MRADPLVFLVAGEPSGDALGQRLMAALRQQTKNRIRFAGVGGERMAAEGLVSLFPMKELSLMGLAEILPHVPRLLGRLHQTAETIRCAPPDIVVTIDSPGFCLRLASRVRGLGIPIFHYVAPQLWAWRPGRARKLANSVDHLMALLPFEPEFFARVGLKCSFVGHPIVESNVREGNAARFRKRHNLSIERPVIAVLPGSRSTEVTRLVPVFWRALRLLADRHRDLTVVIPAAEPVRDRIENAVNNCPVRAIIVTDAQDKADAYAASAAALTKSGTVTLELALAGVPMVVTYRINRLTAMIIRRLIKVEQVALINLIGAQPIVPELLQEHCTPGALADAIDVLLTDPDAAARQRAGFRDVLRRLGDAPPPPSTRAADLILAAIAERSAAKP